MLRELMMAGAMVAAAPVAGAAPLSSDTVIAADRATVDRAFLLVTQHQPAAAVAEVDKVIAASELRQKSDPTRLVSCARTNEETLLNLLEASAAKRSGVVVDGAYCDALFVKGFALIDLGNADGGRAMYQAALSHEPRHAWYRGELAETYKAARDWPRALAEFTQAADDARTFSPPNVKAQELGRALRGMGYALSEMGQLDEAEAKYRECLKIDSNDKGAMNELLYIAQQRRLRVKS